MTAVQWFANELGIKSGSMLDKALEMERQQMSASIGEVVSDGIVSVDPANYMVRYKGENKYMPKKMIQMIHYFITRRGQVVTREQILRDVWGDDVIVSVRTIDVHVRKIRRELFDRCIMTLPRVGYKWN